METQSVTLAGGEKVRFELLLLWNVVALSVCWCWLVVACGWVVHLACVCCVHSVPVVMAI